MAIVSTAPIIVFLEVEAWEGDILKRLCPPAWCARYYAEEADRIDFVESDGHRIKAIHGTRHGKDVSYALRLQDYAFITIGSMTADSRYGDDDHPPQLVRDKADGAWTLWGYGLFIDNKGDYIDKPMAQATGQEILTELMQHLGFEDILDEVRHSTTIIPVMMPYITSEFSRRDVADRPPVIPPGAKNYALLGQYVEILDDVVFTVEYSVRGAMLGVYGLLGVRRESLPSTTASPTPR